MSHSQLSKKHWLSTVERLLILVLPGVAFHELVQKADLSNPWIQAGWLVVILVAILKLRA